MLGDLLARRRGRLPPRFFPAHYLPRAPYRKLAPDISHAAQGIEKAERAGTRLLAPLDKLGVKPGQKIVILGVDDGAFLNDIEPFQPEFAERKPAADLDVIFFRAEAKKELARLASLRKSIVKNGAIWVVYPKGRQDIREIDVIAAGKAAGLTDNKVCGFSITHTALRFVIPLANR